MSQKPIFVATHPRACSTAFERVFMTRRDTLQCIHEPFGDAFYYGPERLSKRYEDDEQARLESGFSQSTFKTVVDRIEREDAESEGKRIFIKDIMHYLLPQDGKPASIAPSLNRIKRGVGTATTTSNGVTHSVDGHTEGEEQTQGNGMWNGHGQSSTSAVGSNLKSHESYPYDTEPESGNPTVAPKEILSRFHFAFLIRDPHSSVPSYYRCTIPPLDKVTGFNNYDPLEAGYDEVRRTFDYLRSVHLIGPHIATREQDADEIDDKLRPVVNGLGDEHESGAEICVIDADDMLEKPAAMIEAFCRSVGVDYDPAMLNWDTEEDHQCARDAFEKWSGFHNDAIESKGLVAKAPHPPKSEEKYDAEWREKYGPEAAALIRKTVDRNMADYLYMKQFAMKV